MKNAIGLLILMLMMSCNAPNPNLNKEGEDALKSHELDREISAVDKAFNEMYYVPIYSDIYFDELNQKNLLSATLSIRNTSLVDSLYVLNIDYYNTEGDIVKKYLDNNISLPPLATINYVVEKEDDSGGPGANFIVGLAGRNSNMRPLIQAVMVGEIGNKSFAFSSDGYSLSK